MKEATIFQESELVCLALAVPLSVPVFFLARAIRAPLDLLMGAVASALAAAVFTVVEDIAFAEFFNLLEHICYALAGLLAAAGAWRLALWSQRAKGGSS